MVSLKEKKISTHDLEYIQRSINKILRKDLFFAKQKGKYKDCFIRGTKLIVDGIAYEVEDLQREHKGTRQGRKTKFTIYSEMQVLSADQHKDSSTLNVRTVKTPLQIIPAHKPLQQKSHTLIKGTIATNTVRLNFLKQFYVSSEFFLLIYSYIIPNFLIYAKIK